MAKSKLEHPASRPVRSVFYRGKTVVRTNHATYPNNAVVNAVRHMQVNEYGATHVEVFSAESGTLYAVLKRGIKTLIVLYKADIENYVGDRHDNS